MADDIIDQLATACTCGPLDADGACLPCCARTEIERLRAALAIAAGMISTMPQYEHQHPESVFEMLLEDIVIGERIRERAANDNGRRTSLGEVAADFGIDLTLDEIKVQNKPL